MDNGEIAAVLREIAVFSELAGENAFKSRAYQNVARAVERHPQSVAALCAEPLRDEAPVLAALAQRGALNCMGTEEIDAWFASRRRA
jgi:DNA polymerase/3'-5' exonuclease PolX